MDSYLLKLRYELFKLSTTYKEVIFIITESNNNITSTVVSESPYTIMVANSNDSTIEITDKLLKIDVMLYKQVIVADEFNKDNVMSLINMFEDKHNSLGNKIVDVIYNYNIINDENTDFVSHYVSMKLNLISLIHKLVEYAEENESINHLKETIDNYTNHLNNYKNKVKSYLTDNVLGKQDINMNHFNLDIPKVSKGLGFQIKQLINNYDFDFNYVLSNGIPLQRPFVWKLEQKQSLILSILYSRDIGNLSFVQHTDKERNIIFKVVDGKQRLSTLMEFMNNQFPVIIKDTPYYYCELPEDIHLFFNRQYLLVDIVYEYYDKPISDKNIVNWFELLNFAGTKVEYNHIIDLKNSLTLPQIKNSKQIKNIDIFGDKFKVNINRTLKKNFQYDNTNPVRFFSNVAVNDRKNSIKHIFNNFLEESKIFEDDNYVVEVSILSGDGSNSDKLETYQIDILPNFVLILKVAFNTNKDTGIMSIVETSISFKK